MHRSCSSDVLPRANCWCPPFPFPWDRLSPLTQVPLSSKPLSSSLVRSPWIFPFATHNTNMHTVDMFEFLKPLFPLLINMKQATRDTIDQPLSFKYHTTSRKDATSSVYITFFAVLVLTCSMIFLWSTSTCLSFMSPHTSHDFIWSRSLWDQSSKNILSYNF